MSNRLFQGVIHQMKDTIDRTIGVIDESSVIIACSELLGIVFGRVDCSGVQRSMKNVSPESQYSPLRGLCHCA